MTDFEPPPDRWGVVTPDRGLCLVLDFTHRPAPGHGVLRLCDRTLVTHAEEKVRRLMTWEAPSCDACRTILQRMLEDGQR